MQNPPNPFWFPDPRRAPEDAPLAWGGDLLPPRLLAAYRQGIFPWYDEGAPILWWCPDPRFVLFPDEFHLPKNLLRVIRKSTYRTTLDRAFEAVIRGCATSPRPGQAGTWLTDDMIAAYVDLHRLGFAHSAEAWRGNQLVGGCYGVAIGKIFFGESMFFRAPDASKVAFAHLVEALRAWNFSLIDCQMPTAHLARFGARAIPRSRFLDIVEEAVNLPGRVGAWG